MKIEIEEWENHLLTMKFKSLIEEARTKAYYSLINGNPEQTHVTAEGRGFIHGLNFVLSIKLDEEV